MTRPTDTPLSCLLHVLPWVLVTVGALIFVIGLSWRNLTSSDAANPVLVICGVLCVMLAGAMSCCADRPVLQDDKPSSQEQQQVPPPQPPSLDSAAAEKSEAQLPLVSI